MDIWDKKKRSEVMSKIRSKNTKPEILLRKALFAKGYRYRINYKKLPGKPDIVFPKYKAAIFVNGCFWHGHEECKYAYTPKTNTNFWVDKITSNIKRDKINLEKLSDLGWSVLTIWECELRHNYKNDMTPLIDRISTLLYSQIHKNISIKIYEEIEEKIILVSEDVVEYEKKSKA